MEAGQVKALLDGGRYVVDVRPGATGHITGAISIPLRDQLINWLSWPQPDNAPIVFVTGPSQELDEIVWLAYKIGYERLARHLAGGMAAWAAAMHPEPAPPSSPWARLRQVRTRGHYSAGHVTCALYLELGVLAGHAADAPAGAVAACGHAMTGASLWSTPGPTHRTDHPGRRHGSRLDQSPGRHGAWGQGMDRC
ncbi:rhodanese-like domain-containing protein [Spirillospora sp. CA-255316]